MNTRFVTTVIKRVKPFGHLFALMALGVLLCGCATKRMVLDSSKANVTNPAKPIALFTLRTQNEYKPVFRPSVRRIQVSPAGNGRAVKFKPGKPYREVRKEYFEYLVSITAEPGDHLWGDVIGRAGDGLLINGYFKFPLETRFNLEPGSVTYLGHVDMVNRKREKGDRRSGPVAPLIDQAVCGFSDGTFKIAVSDRSAEDLAAFEEAYPILRDVSIAKGIMTGPTISSLAIKD